MPVVHVYRPRPTVELTRCVFRQHYIRIMQGAAPGLLEVLIDVWPLEGRTFTSIDAAKQAAITYIRNMGGVIGSV